MTWDGTEGARGAATRVAVYIDGFNLFYGLRTKGWRRYYWLDLRRLAERLLRPDQTLAAVRYFTAPVLPEVTDPLKPVRQRTYLDALATLPGLSTHFGYFAPRSSGGYEEKMTDVNIAVELLHDAHMNLYETAILVSGDSDLTSAVKAVQERYGKRVIVAFPPGRRSSVLRGVAQGHVAIGRQQVRDSQLADRIETPDAVLTRPEEWA